MREEPIKRVPIPGIRGTPWRAFIEALEKAAAAGEAIHLETLPFKEVNLRPNLARWCRKHGYRSHVQAQRDGTYIVWLEPRS